MARVLTPASAASRSMVSAVLPVGFDELLDPAHHPGRRQAFLVFQELAEAVAAGMEEGELHCLLELPADRRRQLGCRRIELHRQEIDQMKEAPGARLVRLDRALEADLAFRLGAEQRRQPLHQRLPVEAKRQAFMSGMANRPRHDVGRRNRKLP